MTQIKFNKHSRIIYQNDELIIWFNGSFDSIGFFLPFIFSVVLSLEIYTNSRYIFGSLLSFTFYSVLFLTTLFSFSEVFRDYKILIGESCISLIDSRLNINYRKKILITNETFAEKIYDIQTGDSSAVYRHSELWINDSSGKSKIPVKFSNNDVDELVKIINGFISRKEN